MRMDMPTCQYGEDHCKKHFDGNCLLKPDLLDERCPIRRTINDVLEIIDDVDKKAGDKTYIVLDDGRFYSQTKYIKEKVLELSA